MKWYEGRPTLVRVRVVQLLSCLLLLIYGFGMWVFDEYYAAPAYTQAFKLATPARWGLAFMIVGAIGVGALVGPRPYSWRSQLELAAGLCQFLRVFFMGMWAMLLFFSVWQFGGGTRFGPIVWIFVAAMDFSSVVRHGTGKADI